MKKEIIFGLLFSMVLIGFASASCDMGVTLLNQDPYPATPGEYVKVVFQVNGTETTECNKVFFDIVPVYPFSIEESDTRIVIPGGTYITGYESFILKAYKLRVDKDALDGDNKIKVAYGFVTGGSTNSYIKDFYINVKDARTDFEVSIQDYDAATKTITFGIINVGKYDIESLTLELPEQENIKLVGGSPAIIGSLSSNDDTTANVPAVPKVGEIKVKLNYNDQNDVRRKIEKTAYFSNNLLENGAAKPTRDIYFYLFWIAIIVVVLWVVYGYFRRKKAKNNKIALLRNR
jgi:hypothetical protein